ncbi:hypothetical protein HELRODRAFT_191777 [Helobdella robusta]|uniref:EGF-like domain-containing protein n=1 Tax=Helobdella robusta TaxID=6412 RepID=T1FTB3_HELRO|nr:hypothetical protein HELRODRAFT_191777 [Helobdella robusta]ESO04452.1 hypothetical protein HELRODRAFT_191777 [Helobdella robusta]
MTTLYMRVDIFSIQTGSWWMWFMHTKLNIILYNRDSCTNGCDYRMNKFIIGLTNTFDPQVNQSIRGKYDLCGQWPADVLFPGQPMRINCSDGNKFSRFVIVQQSLEAEQTDKFLAFSELEVYANDKFLQYENVALYKPAYLSSTLSKRYPNYCVDGKKDTYCQLAIESPPYPNWFVVDLVGAHQVQYTILYARADYYDIMDNFIVGLTNKFDPKINKTIRGQYDICGRWSTAASSSGQPMRVDCVNKNIYYRYVIIQQDVKITLPTNAMTFVELEVYGFENLATKFFGCFKSFQTITSFNDTSVGACLNICKRFNFQYSSVKEDRKCLCGDELELFPPTAACFSNFVYLAKPLALKPIYLGCYNDNSDRDLFFGSNLETLESCFQYCLQNNFTVAGFQYDSYCFCGFSFGKYNRNLESDCSGFSNSIYFFCETFGLNKSCSDIYHCSSQANLGPGMMCPSQICEPGWIGDSCNERDCSVNNGGCGIHECVLFEIESTTITGCICKTGYTKSHYNDDCLDLPNNITTKNNKCADGRICPVHPDPCLQKNASLDCQCSPGFERTNNVCSDINECLNDSNACNSATSACVNKVGSYGCMCFTGYYNKDLYTCEVYQEKKDVMIALVVVSIILLITIATSAAYFIIRKKKFAKPSRTNNIEANVIQTPRPKHQNADVDADYGTIEDVYDSTIANNYSYFGLTPVEDRPSIAVIHVVAYLKGVLPMRGRIFDWNPLEWDTGIPWNGIPVSHFDGNPIP